MSISETADMLNEIVKGIADKRGIPKEQAWEEALEELKEVQKEYKELKI